MPSTSPLLIDLAGVARLADVRRPVASVWRSRFATSADPFPDAVAADRGRPLFDVVSIAQWLARTGRGNNPEVVADAAASAAPRGFDIADPEHVATVDALLAVHAASGESLADLAFDDVRRRALTLDPDDTCLVSELRAAEPAWAAWADELSDAAYSPIQASRLLERRHAATRSPAGAAGPLTGEANTLMRDLIDALAVGDNWQLVVHDGVAASLATDLMVRGDADVVVPPSTGGRSIRRRFLLDGRHLPVSQPANELPRLSIARFPSTSTNSTLDVLTAIDELVLGMRDDDRAVFLAPARMLTDATAASDALVRTDVLRSGRVRAIVKLPAGLVTAAPRAALALWVLGREAGGVPIGDRVTAVADLTDARLTVAARTDLTSDLLAAMGRPREVRSHLFRFTRLVPTASLSAASGALVTGTSAQRRRAPSSRELPAMLDQARAALGDDAPRVTADTAPGSTLPPATIEYLLQERHLRMLPGTRLTPEQLSDGGWVVVSSYELDDPARVGTRRVDPLTFAAAHPSASLTAAGDVIFRTGPTPRAWVDPDGSKVVAHPARVLRINRNDPGGLVPELVAADIAEAPSGPGAWRRWHLRRVAPNVAATLRAALAEVAARRDELARRAADLDDYTELLVAAVVAGAVTLTEHAADAASDPQ